MKSSNAPVMPQKAKQKLKEAEKAYQAVYIYGEIGYGKTELIRNYLKNREHIYISCRNFAFDLESIRLLRGRRKQIVVIDDIWQLMNTELQQEVCRLAHREDIWLILIGRSRMPSWLLRTFIERQMALITEEDICLTREEIVMLGGSYGLSLTEEEAGFLEEHTYGHACGIVQMLALMRGGSKLDERMDSFVRDTFSRMQEQKLEQDCERELVKFFTQVCVVDQFDVSFAEYITGHSQVKQILKRAMDSGNFISEECGVYRIRPFFLNCLRNYARDHYEQEKIREYMYRAAMYYETKNQLADALAMYEKCGRMNRMMDILERNVRERVGANFYRDMEKYYLRLTEEEIGDNPVLMAGVAMTYAMRMQRKESEHWYENLCRLEQETTGIAKKEAYSWQIYLDLALPFRGIREVADRLLELERTRLRNDFYIPEYSITNCMPSMLTGTRNLLEWPIQNPEQYREIEEKLEQVPGCVGKGTVSAFLGEGMLMRGEGDAEAFSLLMRARIEAEYSERKEILFVAVTQLSKVDLLMGQSALAKEQMIDFIGRLTEEDPPIIARNARAVLCRIALYENDAAAVRRWMEEAPNENDVFHIMDSYCYMSKIRCCIWDGDYMRAAGLFQRLAYCNREYDRTYLSIELALMEAIGKWRMGEPWEQIFVQTLEQTRCYHLVRLVALEGAAILPLLAEIREAYCAKNREQSKWWKQVYQETKRIAELYPGYLQARAATAHDFSDNALRILQMQADGKTIKQIASELCLSEATIKYHAAENYRKLGVKGKTVAVQKARNLGILR